MSYASLRFSKGNDRAPQQRNSSQVSDRQLATPLNILLVEDDASDVMLAEISLDAAKLNFNLFTLNNGAGVLPYLQQKGHYSYMPRPDVLMLDLSLPNKDGFEILAELAETKCYSQLPIVILTGDKHCSFLKDSYDLNIVAYLTKPCSADKIRGAMMERNRPQAS